MIAKLGNSLDRLGKWVEDHDYRAYDPGDGQLSPFRHLAFKRHFPKRLLTAVVLRMPFNFRPLMGIRPHTSTKGMGYMAWGYLKRYRGTGDERFAARGRACLDWLVSHRAPGHEQYCWGNHFDFTTRGGTIPAFEPTIVWSSLIGQAFLEAYEVLNDKRYLEIASSICDWIMALPREQTASGTCLSYVGFEQSSIHNSNMLGAALVAQVSVLTGKRQGLDLAREAMTYSCSRQHPDGSWFYAEHPKYHWIDNFHTGYNLDSLWRYTKSTGDSAYQGHLQRGFRYFKDHFFEPNGRPRYYHCKPYPIDIQCAAQAIDTLTTFSGHQAEGLGLAQKVAGWTIENMQDPDGHFYYRDLGWIKIKTPMLHWGQGTMFKALAHLVGRLKDPVRAEEMVGAATPAK